MRAKTDCKDIDVSQLDGEPIYLDCEYKNNPLSRHYGDLRLDLHYNGHKWEELYGNRGKIIPGKRWLDENMIVEIEGYRVLSIEGFEILHWLLHYFAWQPDFIQNHAYTVRKPTGETETALREVLGDDLFDFISDNAKRASLNSAVNTRTCMSNAGEQTSL